MSNKGWPPEHVAALKQMEGCSASQMRHALQSLRPGVTRSAVVGQCHRRGIRMSAGASKAQRRKNMKFAFPFGRSEVPLAPNRGRPDAWAPIEGATPVELLSRKPMQCAWPVEQPARPAEQLFCGARCDDDTLPYCATHRRMRVSEQALTPLEGLARSAA